MLGRLWTNFLILCGLVLLAAAVASAASAFGAGVEVAGQPQAAWQEAAAPQEVTADPREGGDILTPTAAIALPPAPAAALPNGSQTAVEPALPLGSLSQVPDSAETLPLLQPEDGSAPESLPPQPQVIPLTGQTLPQARPTGAPERLVIPKIGLDAPVELAQIDKLTLRGHEFQQWRAPDHFAAGWHDSSALLGAAGNTVLSGHHNVHGEVFGRLVDLEVGDHISAFSGGHEYRYAVVNKMILPEKYEQLDVRLENARWIMPSQDERLTLVTCWPKKTNTHRLVIVAQPVFDP